MFIIDINENKINVFCFLLFTLMQSYTHFGLGFKIELSSSATDLTMSVNMVAVVFVAMLDY